MLHYFLLLFSYTVVDGGSFDFSNLPIQVTLPADNSDVITHDVQITLPEDFINEGEEGFALLIDAVTANPIDIGAGIVIDREAMLIRITDNDGMYNTM